MKTDADIVVVGGGPVGLATAIEGRLAGFSVTVVEPRDTPVDKACGEGLMPGAVTALQRLGVRPTGHPIAGIAYVDGRRRVEHRFESGTGMGVRRLRLQEALASRADALGVERIVGAVETIEPDATGVGVTGRGCDGIRGAWLVGCDGLHSTVRRLAGLEGGPVRQNRRRFGLRRHFRLEPWSDVVEVHWTPEVEAYLTPVGPDTVGIAILGPQRVDFAAALAGVPVLGHRFAAAEPVSALRGAGPLLQRTARRTAGRVLLAGDASGYVDALTGEGLCVGFAQARAVVASIAAGDAHAYERSWRSSTRDFRVITGGLVALARSPLRSRIVPMASTSPRAFGAVIERLAR